LSANKLRLDRLLVAKGLAPSRERARAMIMAGKIMVNSQPAAKAGILVAHDDCIELKGKDIPWVSRGGLKLDAALQALALDVTGSICLDVGASTGGFTDCLLHKGAARVYAVDVGYGQLAWKLRQDPRVVVIERTNIRYMPAEAVAEPIDLATIDVSFISLKIVVPAVTSFLDKDARILALIKPQFEVGRNRVGKGGVVRDETLHAQVIHELSSFFKEKSIFCEKVIPSPVLGPKGNREFFILLQPKPGGLN
jgi:23S rRNA (cytidine1920-2'-O)/16S rRNA (cytidine1409-2'-O)-methyltransferase